MSDTYTPGPWHISKHMDGRDMLVYDADGFEVARVCYPNRGANAALIAAAPGLLAALRGVMDAYLDLCDNDSPNYASYEFRQEKWKAANRAIQLATGKNTEEGSGE